jgi:hypothetical protein
MGRLDLWWFKVLRKINKTLYMEFHISYNKYLSIESVSFGIMKLVGLLVCITRQFSQLTIVGNMCIEG